MNTTDPALKRLQRLNLFWLAIVAAAVIIFGVRTMVTESHG